VECADCRFRYLKPRPDPDTLAGFYRADYPAWALQVKPDGQTVDIEQESVTRRFRQVANQRLALVDRFLDRTWTGMRILDIGCGNGAFLLELVRRHEVEAWGMDISDSSLADLARLEPRLRLVRGELSNGQLPAESFDVITLWHVLEHDGDPVGCLRRALGWLRPGGLLLAEVPNSAGFIAHWCGRNWLGWDLPRHLVHFSAASLRRAARKAGCSNGRVLREYTLNPVSLSPLLASLAIWDRQRRGCRTMKQVTYHRWDDGWAKWLLRIVNGVERLLGGNGLLLVAGKRDVESDRDASPTRSAAA
jgi:2-polyprenyl-3-methyl-5-hydroxy-6-metoxy-1,4-benzoquinol methylase